MESVAVVAVMKNMIVEFWMLNLTPCNLTSACVKSSSKGKSKVVPVLN
jgi:hypothetical protein